MKRFFALLLALLMVLSLTACVSSNNAAQTTATETAALSPEAAAEQAAAETKDTTSLSDIIRVPFGYLLDWLYVFSSNYGVALILFSLIVKLVLLPMSIKSKKSMLKMSRLSPQVKALEAKYGDDKQKYQLAVQQMYKEEGVSMGGGCLWSFIPLIILLPLYYVIREPITYMMHNSRSISEAIVAFLQASGENLGKNAYYAQLAAAGHIGDYMEELKSLAVTANANLQAMNFQFLGIDLAAIPTFRFWDCEGWSEIGLFLIPVVSAGLQAVSMWISQKMNNQVATNADGEQDADAAKTANQTNATMMLMMPLVSLWICYTMPAALGIYWIVNSILGILRDVSLTKVFNKQLDKLDAERIARELASREVGPIRVYNLSYADPSVVLRDVFRFDTLIVGGPTYNGNLFPPVAELLDRIAARGIPRRRFGWFGSFCWAGASVRLLAEFAQKMKWDPLCDPVEMKQGYSHEMCDPCATLAETVAGCRCGK